MKGDKEGKKVRDKKVDKEAGLKSWDPKKVRSILTCFSCGKRRCIFSKENGIDYKNVSVALQQKYESVSERFTCGDLLFPDNHPFSRLLAQRTNINCESQIEKAYFNVPVRGFKTQDACIHCGEGCREERKSDFLLGQEELQERNATAGYSCYPIGTMCLDGGKKVVMYNERKPNLVQAVTEKKTKKASGKKSDGKAKK